MPSGRRGQTIHHHVSRRISSILFFTAPRDAKSIRYS